MNWTRALAECVHVMAELHALREAGFTEAALAFPRPPWAVRFIAAFNGGPAGWVPPRGWHYFPNAGSVEAWERVRLSAKHGGDAAMMWRAWCRADDHEPWPNDATRKAWERVFAAAREFVAEAA